MLGKEN